MGFSIALTIFGLVVGGLYATDLRTDLASDRITAGVGVVVGLAIAALGVYLIVGSIR